MAQLVEALRYKLEGRELLFFCLILPPALWPWPLTEMSTTVLSEGVKAAGA